MGCVETDASCGDLRDVAAAPPAAAPDTAAAVAAAGC